jgi:hypothetical protein
MKQINKQTYRSIVKIVRNPKKPGLIKVYLDLPGTQKSQAAEQELLVNILSKLPEFINRINRIKNLLRNMHITMADDELGHLLMDLGAIKDDEPCITLINVQTLVESLNALYNRKP